MSHAGHVRLARQIAALAALSAPIGAALYRAGFLHGRRTRGARWDHAELLWGVRWDDARPGRPPVRGPLPEQEARAIATDWPGGVLVAKIRSETSWIDVATAGPDAVLAPGGQRRGDLFES